MSMFVFTPHTCVSCVFMCFEDKLTAVSCLLLRSWFCWADRPFLVPDVTESIKCVQQKILGLEWHQKSFWLNKQISVTAHKTGLNFLTGLCWSGLLCYWFNWYIRTAMNVTFIRRTNLNITLYTVVSSGKWTKDMNDLILFAEANEYESRCLTGVTPSLSGELSDDGASTSSL